MNKVKTIGVKVKLNNTERVRRELIKRDFLNKDLKIIRTKDHSIIPVKIEKKTVLKDKKYEIIEAKFNKLRKKINSYKKLLRFPKEIEKNLPSSYDIIGDIALIKLNLNLKKYSFKIGKAIIRANKNIKTVLNVEPVSGELRTRNVEFIAGEKKTKTIHKEFGMKFIVDINDVYFSPRLANERKRIANQVKKDEIIVDMFTGVAPFPIVINKFSNPKIIFAIDKNKKAIDLAEKNIRINKMYEKIKLIHGDSKNIKNLIPNEIKADRIIMNLPFSSNDFLDYAFKIIKKRCIINYYEVIDESKIRDRIKELKKLFQRKSINLENIRINKIKSYTPREFYICFDITAKRNHNADVA